MCLFSKFTTGVVHASVNANPLWKQIPDNKMYLQSRLMSDIQDNSLLIIQF